MACDQLLVAAFPTLLLLQHLFVAPQGAEAPGCLLHFLLLADDRLQFSPALRRRLVLVDSRRRNVAPERKGVRRCLKIDVAVELPPDTLDQILIPGLKQFRKGHAIEVGQFCRREAGKGLSIAATKFTLPGLVSDRYRRACSDPVGVIRVGPEEGNHGLGGAGLASTVRSPDHVKPGSELWQFDWVCREADAKETVNPNALKMEFVHAPASR